MRVPLNDLRRAHARYGPAREAAMLGVLRSGWYVMGPECTAFEKELGAFIGVGNCVGVGNGTDALELALRALDANAGQEVITAANAGGYTSTACRLLGLKPVYADVDPRSASITAATVEPLLGDNTLAVVVTHLYGQLADIEPLVQLCNDNRIPLVEDCAQALGATRRGAKAGSFGDLATFSFYPTKNLGALGDAGAVVCRDEGLAEKLRRLRQYGWGDKYVVTTRGGRNSRLDELQAACLRVALPTLGADNARRREIADRYRESLGDGDRLIGDTDESYVAHLAVVVTRDRAALRGRLAEAGVDTAIHYPVPDHQQPVYAAPARLAVTELLCQQILTVPCFPELDEGELTTICDALAG